MDNLEFLEESAKTYDCVIKIECKKNKTNLNVSGNIYAFHKFCEVAEKHINISRERVSFCGDFITGVWNNDRKHSHRALSEGIIWYNRNKAIDAANKK